jgi:cell division protein FtsZ
MISITGGKDLTLYRVDEAATRIREEVHADANIIVGATFEESLDGVIRVSVVATGVDTSSAKCPPGGVPHRAGVAAGPCRIVSGRLAQCPSAGGSKHAEWCAEELINSPLTTIERLIPCAGFYRQRSIAMLDQRAFQAHFSDDPVYGVSRPSSVASQLNSPELIQALAALEKEFRSILGQIRQSTE